MKEKIPVHYLPYEPRTRLIFNDIRTQALDTWYGASPTGFKQIHLRIEGGASTKKSNKSTEERPLRLWLVAFYQQD